MFVVVLAINILKGGGAFPSPLGIKCGSGSFYLFVRYLLFFGKSNLLAALFRTLYPVRKRTLHDTLSTTITRRPTTTHIDELHRRTTKTNQQKPPWPTQPPRKQRQVSFKESYWTRSHVV